MVAQSIRKVLSPHPFQRRTDQVAIRLKKPRRNPRQLTLDSLCLILEHADILHGVLAGNAVGNAVAINDGLSIESKQCGTEFRIEPPLIQAKPPPLLSFQHQFFGLLSLE